MLCKKCKAQLKGTHCNTCDPKKKIYYNVVVETLLPATISYRVLAETAEEAVEMIRNMRPSDVKYRLNGRREIKLTVYEFGQCVVKYMKNLFGVIR